MQFLPMSTLRSTMPRLRWEQKYSVGVPTLDAQHQKLFRMINAMQEAMLHGGARDMQQEVFATLQEEAQLHFTREETLLRACHYPGLVEHRREHRAFLEELGRLRQRMNRGVSSAGLDLMDFLRRWIQAHLLEKDMDYRQWLLPK
jgi:hemerythrin-like metal-binding protein